MYSSNFSPKFPKTWKVFNKTGYFHFGEKERLSLGFKKVESAQLSYNVCACLIGSSVNFCWFVITNNLVQFKATLPFQEGRNPFTRGFLWFYHWLWFTWFSLVFSLIFPLIFFDWIWFAWLKRLKVFEFSIFQLRVFIGSRINFRFFWLF